VEELDIAVVEEDLAICALLAEVDMEVEVPKISKVVATAWHHMVDHLEEDIQVDMAIHHHTECKVTLVMELIRKELMPDTDQLVDKWLVDMAMHLKDMVDEELDMKEILQLKEAVLYLATTVLLVQDQVKDPLELLLEVVRMITMVVVNSNNNSTQAILHLPLVMDHRMVCMALLLELLLAPCLPKMDMKVLTETTDNKVLPKTA